MERTLAMTVMSVLIGGVGALDAKQPVDDNHGYRLGDGALPRAPITMEELETLKKSLLFTEDDVRALRRSREVLQPHIGELVGVWYGFVGANPHLLAHFTDARTGEPDGAYLARVRARFEKWVVDTAAADFDEAWLDYQFEIGRRHHAAGKNRTDGANASPQVEFRHLVALTIPVTTTIRPFLERGGDDEATVDAMQAAWTKAVLLQAILWSYPYVEAGSF
jgi:hypothetical protein